MSEKHKSFARLFITKTKHQHLLSKHNLNTTTIHSNHLETPTDINTRRSKANQPSKWSFAPPWGSPSLPFPALPFQPFPSRSRLPAARSVDLSLRSPALRSRPFPGLNPLPAPRAASQFPLYRALRFLLYPNQSRLPACEDSNREDDYEIVYDPVDLTTHLK